MWGTLEAVAGLKNSRDAKARGRTGCFLPFSAAAGQSAPILGSADVSGSQRSVCSGPKALAKCQEVAPGPTRSVLRDLAIPRSIYWVVSASLMSGLMQ